ncbi:hypothetical protein HPB48_001296 [Haemaphysalis longicornis]|uniref:Uncharacterized protein n=1 Tax=Haemaphysalis longicornis TaxID=44386 RepID=A0A9J6GVL6_HAELO|nr:hypothetical protein HPB48_001296 [Haemaphysalis longicornis]
MIEKASLKPLQKVHWIRQFVVPALRNSSSNTLQVDNKSRRLDKTLGMKIKEIMHSPQCFPNSHIWFVVRSGGFGVLKLNRAEQSVQFKLLCHRIRLSDPAVNSFFDEILGACHKRISALFDLPKAVSDAKVVDAALKRGTE